ncbi:MAG: DUF5684 domain-containing protein [Candidatus Saccharibacteria bacterium]|nr:DUF5684 domain-containing protein [Candidatus Saccharibacteria bacterium]
MLNALKSLATSINFTTSTGDSGSISITDGEAAGILGLGFGFMLVMIIGALLLTMVLQWGVYKKGGYPGWAGIVPFYNSYCLCKMAGVDIVIFVIGIFIPLVHIYTYIELAKKFGKDALWGVGLFLLGFIFFPILGYGDAKFNGPKGPYADKK